jgi:CheY-like chemotaxis protein
MIFESVKELLFNIVKYANVNTAELFLKYDKEYICIIVKDQGRGFDAKHIEKLSSDKGFGLFSIRERLKLLNGTINISSEVSKGTEIEIKIPISNLSEKAQAQINSVSMNELARQEKEKKINVLLVDDHKIVREGIANLLKENPSLHVVAQAEDGIDAVEKVETFMPDVVVMDINMPRLNGIEATRVIKNKFPNIDIIGLSVQDEHHIAESMKKAGALALLNKAGDPQELIKIIISCKLKRMVV